MTSGLHGSPALKTSRNATLREIERRRSDFAARLRQATKDRDNVEEASFQVIEAPAASIAPAAGANVA